VKAALAQDLLDALTQQVAVLDARGTIVAANRAWRDFARANGGAADGYVGQSYVAACEAAASNGDALAAALLADLGALLRGEREHVALEYPCHSPDQRRWFMARLARFSHGGEIYVAATHENVTDRKLAETGLQEAEAVLRDVLAREQEKARTDELTGLGNRRHFFDIGGQLLTVARRYRTPLSLVLFDIDEFKRINDSRGHQAGDAVLKDLALIARAHARDADVVARYGGEEFVVLLPNTGPNDALLAAEKLREQVSASPVLAEAAGAPVTLSAGVASLFEGESLDDLIRRADDALYAAKRAGRNCSRLSALGTPRQSAA